MNQNHRLLIGLLLPVLIAVGCNTTKNSPGKTIQTLTFLGEFDLPHGLLYQGTTVGGLSGIDYNPQKDEYYLICDDRSDLNPARFYTAKIHVRQNGIDTVQLTGVTTLRQKNGQPYPGSIQYPWRAPDPEALRFDPVTNTFLWSSEGERSFRNNKWILCNPSINRTDLQGQLLDTFPLPDRLQMQAASRGPRQNGVLEGLAFTPDFKTLFVSVEEPLYEDGPRAGLNDTAGWIRILQYDLATKQPVAQFGYRIDPVVKMPHEKGGFYVNGVSDILAINGQQLLVTERSYSAGESTCNIRIYLAKLHRAANIAANPSLQINPPKRPVQKKLLVNMDTLDRGIDNVEGATFGPRLPNGKQTLLFITDDNFSPAERTQFLLFEVQ